MQFRIVFAGVLLAGYVVFGTGSPLMGSHHEWVDVDDNSPAHLVADRVRDLKNFIDHSVDPCQDFYNFSCGNWLKSNTIPEDSIELSIFLQLKDRLNNNLREVLEAEYEYVDNSNSAITKAKRFYASCINETAAEIAGVEPLLANLRSFGKWPLLDPDWREEDSDWIKTTAKMQLIGVETFFTLAVSADLYDSNRQIVHIAQRGLSEQALRGSLSVTEEDFTPVGRTVFRMLVTALQRIGVDKIAAIQAADDTIRLNERVARSSTPKLELATNFPTLYEKMTVAQLNQTVPELNFLRMAAYLGIDINDNTEVAVIPMSYVKNVSELIHNTEPRKVANYIMCKYVEHYMDYTDSKMRETKQVLLSKVTGVTKFSPRWEECLENVREFFNEPLSALYVRKYFDEESRQDVITLTTELRDMFKQRVSESEWMDETTKAATLDKIDKMVLQLGYPPYLLDDERIDEEFDDLVIRENKFFQNVVNVGKHNSMIAIRRLSKPVDQTMFGMSPISINAGYDLSKNVILLTAAILQPPIYSRFYPKAMNYGSIGAFIAHEIMHAFDSVGQSFFADGTLQNLWSDGTKGQYNEISTCFKDQYSRYTIGENYVNGDHTANENVADNTGLQTAYEAYQRWLSFSANIDGEKIDGLDWRNNQLFFISYAQLWCQKTRPEVIELKMKDDPHSPANYRVIGTLANFHEFSNEFDCSLGTEMNPLHKCKVI